MKLLVFFTFGVSLKTWIDTGIISREVEVYRELTKRGVDVSFFTYGDAQDISIANNLDFSIEVFPLYEHRPPFNFKFFNFIYSFWFIITRNKQFKNFDFFKSNQFWGSWLPFFCKLIFKRPFILRCGFEYNTFIKNTRSRFFILLTHFISRILYRSADRIFVTSISDLNFISNIFLRNEDKNKISLLPNLIHTDKFKPINLKPSRDILVIARLEVQKDVGLAITIASELNLSLTLIGKGSLVKEICNLAESILKDFVYIESISNDEIPFIINDHRFYLSTSLYEGNPKSLLEAMSTGCVVVARNSPGINSIIDSGVNGYLFTDIDHLRILLKEISTLSSNFSKIKKNAREYVVKNHDLSLVSDSEYNAYIELKNPSSFLF